MPNKQKKTSCTSVAKKPRVDFMVSKKNPLSLEELIKKFEEHSLICQKQEVENNENFNLPEALRTMCLEIEKIKKALIDKLKDEIRGYGP